MALEPALSGEDGGEDLLRGIVAALSDALDAIRSHPAGGGEPSGPLNSIARSLRTLALLALQPAGAQTGPDGGSATSLLAEMITARQHQGVLAQSQGAAELDGSSGLLFYNLVSILVDCICISGRFPLVVTLLNFVLCCHSWAPPPAGEEICEAVDGAGLRALSRKLSSMEELSAEQAASIAWDRALLPSGGPGCLMASLLALMLALIRVIPSDHCHLVRASATLAQWIQEIALQSAHSSAPLALGRLPDGGTERSCQESGKVSLALHDSVRAHYSPSQRGRHRVPSQEQSKLIRQQAPSHRLGMTFPRNPPTPLGARLTRRQTCPDTRWYLRLIADRPDDGGDCVLVVICDRVLEMVLDNLKGARDAYVHEMLLASLASMYPFTEAVPQNLMRYPPRAA